MRPRKIKMLNSTTTCSGTDSGGVIAQTCMTEYAQSTSTDPTFYYGFSQGEIVLIVMSVLIWAVGMVLTYHVLFRKIKIKNQ
jgi:hypothetical protein